MSWHLETTMATMYYDTDADLSLIQGRKVAIIGYGSQGHAHALNLKDSGVSVRVGLPTTSRSRAKAQAAGLVVGEVGEVAKWADVVMILIPDHVQGKIYREEIEPNLQPGNMPLFAIQQDATGHARALTLSYAKGIGVMRAGVIETTFKEETETDLFGEQAVLCGGVSALVKAGFETLVDAGYQPEIAYFECLHELKLIVDLIYQGGLNYMRYSVSDTAENGDYTGGPRIVTDATRREMRQRLAEIQNGTYAKAWIAENEAGRPAFNKLREADRNHPIEQVGVRLRALMPFLKPIAAEDTVGTR